MTQAHDIDVFSHHHMDKIRLKNDPEIQKLQQLRKRQTNWQHGFKKVRVANDYKSRQKHTYIDKQQFN